MRVNDFFCGAGGMGLGFKKAGFEIAGAWDWDKYAVESYRYNIGNHVKISDITKMTWEDVPKADVWTFGFPCQDLSNAGKQAGLFNGERSRLFFEVMRLIDETKKNDPSRLPIFLLAENVKGLKKYLPVLKEEYNNHGYRMSYSLYNSKFWGVPQNRERYFVAGIRSDMKKAFNFPRQSEKIEKKLVDILEKEVDRKYYIDELKLENLLILDKIDVPQCFTERRTEEAKRIRKEYMRKYGRDFSPRRAKELVPRKDGISNCLTTGLTREHIVIVKQATKQGYDIAFEGDSINISHPESKTRRGRVGKEVAQTLVTSPEQVTLDKNEIRYFTPREFGRLQGFPDSYEIVVSERQFYKQMGNAVTVNVAEAVALKIKEYVESTKAVKA